MLAGKKIVVVGGSSGIGLATAEIAKRAGADVFIASRNAERLKAAAEKIGATAVATDVTQDDSVAALFRATGPADHVVVTAAQLRTGPFKTVAMEDVRATLEGKFWGAWRVARAAEIRAGGSLTLVSGFLSIRPRPNSAIVGAANGALESLTRGLALELAPVRVNCVSPGIIDTPMARRIEAPDRPTVYAQQRRFAHLFAASLRNPAQPSVVAEKIREIIESNTWQLRHPVGPDSEPLLAWRRSMTDEQWVDLHAASDDVWYERLERDFGMEIRPRT